MCQVTLQFDLFLPSFTFQVDFQIDPDILKSLKERVFDEIARIKKEIARQKVEEPNSVPNYEQSYWIKQFVFDIMGHGFSEKYLAGRKMTSQNGSRGADVRKQMNPCDLNYIISK